MFDRPLEAIRAAMFGHAIADAMGVPVEFMDREELRKDPVLDYRGYGSHGVPAGTWSDDTSMALATLDSLADGVNYEDMMRRFYNWKKKSRYTATDEVFDIGTTTNEALRNYADGMPALKCGCSGEYDNGNGSLMRIIPAVLYCKYKIPFAPLEGHMDLIHRVSSLTHAHPRAMMGCGIYALILMELLSWQNTRAIRLGLEKAKEYYSFAPGFEDEMRHYGQVFDLYDMPCSEEEINSGGYVVGTLKAALWCLLTTESYSECILKAVNLGRDTDTVAAVAGGLAGVLYGVEDIPEKWYQGLIRHEMIDQLCEAFAEG
ncbi:MAG: ADP-ribosylglycohydrolase family protein [Clostridia bacterium]|nr:ADP-ribosylglycohydrolase family protein [Clostridia bacterium]MBQ4085300.1 ADP-ribosylglycohydrolase family protein [Clostridia bacterium]